jgi:hypothetical protein
MAAAPKRARWQIAATKGADAMTRTRLLWAALVAAVTTAVFAAAPAVATIAGIVATGID